MAETAKNGKKVRVVPIIIIVLVVLLLAAAGTCYGFAKAQTKVSAVHLTCPERVDIGGEGAVTYEVDVDYPAWLPEFIRGYFVESAREAARVFYTSTNADVLTVDENGKLVGVAKGDANIVATAGENTAFVAVRVGPDDPTGVTGIEEIYVKSDGTDSVNAKAGVEPETADDALTYEIEDTDVATVDEDGNVTGVAEGYTNLIVKACNGLSVTIPVTSATYANDCKFEVNEWSMELGDGFFPGIVISNDEEVTSFAGDFEISDENVLIYHKDLTKFEAVGYGTATIHLTLYSGNNVFEDDCEVTVVAPEFSTDADGNFTATFGGVTYSTKPQTTTPSGGSTGGSTSGGSTGGSTGGRTGGSTSGSTGGSTGGSTTPSTPTAPYYDTALAQSIFAQINAYRAQNGLAPVIWDASVAAIADSRAAQIVSDFSHNGMCTMLENLHWDTSGGTGCFTGWQNSPVHNTNMLWDCIAQLYGAVSVYVVDGTGYCVYVANA